MKKLVFLLIIAFSVDLYSQQVNLYDRYGNATVYIDYSNNGAIYTWDGRPVAFIEQKGSDYAVFTYNGEFLGWYDNGAIYDQNGNIMAASENNFFTVPSVAPVKAVPQIEPVRPVTPVVPVKPIFSMSWSSMDMSDIFK